MAKALSLNEIRRRAAQFAIDWQDAPGEERQYAQSFVADLLGVFGITKRKAAFYEKRAQRTSTGRAGFIDALVPGLALFEMKSEGADLEAAERQALDYIDGLDDIEIPQWVITSDFRTFRILDLQGESGADTEVFMLAELPEKYDKLVFLAGRRTRTFGDEEQEAASIKAAQLMATLYEELADAGYDGHDASVFLVRTLFALYADDAGIWERDLFYEFIETRTNEDGSDLGPQIAMLFQTLNRPVEQRQANLDDLLKRFPYVNGAIFEGAINIPSFNSPMRKQLLRACAFNWADISPAIFGSLFQAVKSPEARRELGEHYTTETNILKTIEPLFLDELREEYSNALHSKSGLRRLRQKLKDIRVLDPACGCGNFLVVAYRELRQLDLDILIRLQELGDTSLDQMLYFTKDDLAVTLDHFAGIEIEEWPAQIATTAMHLADHQANQEMERRLGKAPDPLPLDQIGNIYQGNALRLDWTNVVPPTPGVRIVGNPPFLGHATRSSEQAQELRDVWGRKDIGRLDYVTGWYKKALDYFDRIPIGGRFAFVSTSSISQGEPVPALFKPIFNAGWRIRFAHQTFAWTSEAPGAAAVHCVITGFDKKEKTSARIFSYNRPKAEPLELPATHINAYLLDAPNVFIEQRRRPLADDLPPASFGNMPRDGGNLVVEANEYDEVVRDSIAAKYLRRYVGSQELIHNEPRWCLWLVDLEPKDLERSPVLQQRVAAVREFRRASRAASTQKMAETPHLFGQRSQPNVPFICIPSVFSEHRRYATTSYFSSDVIPSNLTFKAEDPDGFAFGIVSSAMFLAWQRAVGGRLESRLRFSNTIVWNSFPLPEISVEMRQQIIEAGKGVLEARELHPERSLADHYNPLAMSPELLRAHRALDRVVDLAFGAKTALSTDAERQALLFKQYEKLSGVSK